MGQTKPAAGLKSLNRAADTLSTLLAQEVKELNDQGTELEGTECGVVLLPPVEQEERE